MKKIVSAEFESENYVAIKENSLVDFFYEAKNNQSLVNNVYLAQVKNILTDIQAAFLDLGSGRKGFLHISDLKNCNKSQQIEENLQTGDKLIVQVKKDAVADKKAKVSNYITLTGNYLILTNQGQQLGVSKKIKRRKERHRLKDILRPLLTDELGVIIRTRALKKSEELLKKEFKVLANRWEEIKAKAENSSQSTRVYQSDSLIERVFKKEAGRDLAKVIVDSKESYNYLKEIADSFNASLSKKIKYYSGSQPIFKKYDLGDDIKTALKKKVSLSSGGYIVFDNTEAMTVVDVNTGKNVIKGKFSDVIYKTNYQAAREIIRQLKLRNIGGIIVIDFIDMKRKKDQKKLIKILKKELAKDSRKSSVLGMTNLGLAEITREQRGLSLKKQLTKSCDSCLGVGRLLKEKAKARLDL